MLKKQITSLLAIMMAFAVVIGFTPQMLGPVYAEETENYGLVNGIDPKAEGAVIWMGEAWMTNNNWNSDSRERQWRIIGENDSNWLLISDGLIRNNDEDGAITWQDAIDLCGTLYNEHFSAAEQAAVPITEKNEPDGYTYQDSAHSGTDAYWDFGNQSVNANLFLLSAEEAETYLETNDKRTPGPWWLRSPLHSREEGSVTREYRGFIVRDGSFWFTNDTNTVNCSWTRPAFQIDRSQVIFVSDAENGKPSDMGADALATFKEAFSDEWKLTLKDPGREDFDVTKVVPSESGFTVTYTGAETGTNEFISAIVKNENGDITKYGRIANVTAASGEVTINTEGKLGENDTLYVFNEQYNGDKKSDSVSELKEIATPQSIMIEVGPDHGTAATELKEALDGYLTDEKFPAFTEISIEGSTIHIDFPMFVNNTNGEVVNLLTDALQKNTETFYGEDYNRKEIGYQSSYESDAVRTAELNEKNDLALEDGQIFYLLWDKPFKSVNVTVNDTPQCGFTVTGGSAESQTPKPDCTITENGIDSDGRDCYWWTTSSAVAGEGTYYEGTVNGGDEMNVFVSLKAKYGYYYVPSQTTCIINDSPAKDVRGDGGALMFTGTIPVEHAWDTGKITKQPTETAKGVKTYTCKVCGETKTETIPAKGYTPGGDPNQKGADGTAVGPDASAAAADRAITHLPNDNDPAGSVYGKLQAKSTKQTKKSVNVKWNKVKGATKYVIYGNACGTKIKMKKLATSTGKSKTFKKIAGKKVKKGTYYKFIIVALDKNNNVVSTSKIVHVATKGGKVGNHKSVTVKKSVLKKAKKLKKGKSLKLKAKAVKASKLKVKKHRAVCFESSNPKIATVSKKGVVKGKNKGTCYIYAYAQNGVAKKIKIVVK